MSSANKYNLVLYDGEICISGYLHFDIDFIPHSKAWIMKQGCWLVESPYLCIFNK